MFGHLLIRFFCWIAIAAGIFACAIRLDPLFGTALTMAIWAGVSAAACAIGAALLESQPLGVATWLGSIGGSFVRWGFLAGRGRLLPAVAISWLIWVGIGIAVIAAVKNRDSLSFILMDLAWLVDAGFLCYIIGIMLVNRKAPPALLKVAAAVSAMLLASAVLWFFINTDKSRHTALLIAGGPPLFVGGGYGLFLLVMLTVGRGARWN